MFEVIVSRRTAMTTAAAAVATVAAAPAAGSPGSLVLGTHALHLHGSFSEDVGRIVGQAELCRSLSLPSLYLHMTEHDWRVDGPLLPRTYEFTTLTGWMTWAPKPDNTTGSVVAITTLSDGPAAGAKGIRLRTPATAAASTGIITTNTRNLLEGNLTGRHLGGTLWYTGGHADLRVRLSDRSGVARHVHFRFGSVAPRDEWLGADEAVVWLAAAPRTWTTFDVMPIDHVARLWPGDDPADCSIVELEVNALSSAGTRCTVLLPSVELARDTTGEEALAAYRAVVGRVQAAYPDLVLSSDLEYSAHTDTLVSAGAHAGGLFPSGSAPLLPQTYPSASSPDYVARVAELVHAHEPGALVALNHPFGVSTTAALSTARQNTLLAKVLARILTHRAYGVDLVEIGYRVRGGVDLGHHLSLMYLLLRNGLVFTAVGTTDDHQASMTSWLVNPGLTHVWATGTSRAAQLAALARGTAYVTVDDPRQGRPELWLELGGAPMGSIQTTADPTSTLPLVLGATKLRPGSTVSVLRGVIDYPGAGSTATGVTTVATYSAKALAAGAVQLRADRSRSWYYLAVVKSSSGSVVAFTNPVITLFAPDIDPARQQLPTDRVVAPGSGSAARGWGTSPVPGT